MNNHETAKVMVEILKAWGFRLEETNESGGNPLKIVRIVDGSELKVKWTPVPTINGGPAVTLTTDASFTLQSLFLLEVARAVVLESITPTEFQ